MIAECISLTLECDNHLGCRGLTKAGPAFYETTAESWTECARAARMQGWTISTDRRTCYCPECRGKIKERYTCDTNS